METHLSLRIIELLIYFSICISAKTKEDIVAVVFQFTYPFGNLVSHSYIFFWSKLKDYLNFAFHSNDISYKLLVACNSFVYERWIMQLA